MVHLSTVVKLHPRQGGVDVDHWNPGQELRNWWSLPIWTLTKHWPPSAEWPYVVGVCGLAETTSCCTFWARNNETLKQKKSASRSEFKSPLVIESRKSVAAAGSQQNAKSHYKRKWKGCGSKGKGGGAGGAGCKGKARQKRTWHVAHKHIHSNKRWQPQLQWAPPKRPYPS